jgi:hypothetical protein
VALIVVAYLTLANSVVGAVISLERGEGVGWLGIDTGLTTRQDFLYGLGTSIAPPLWFLVIFAAATWVFATRGGPARRIALWLLTLIGLTIIIGTLGEPLTYQALSLSGLWSAEFFVVTFNFALGLAMLVLGARTLLAERVAPKNENVF